jgi:hypothetical protein
MEEGGVDLPTRLFLRSLTYIKVVALILLLLLPSLCYAEDGSLSNDGNFWLSYGKRMRETDGSVTQIINLKSNVDAMNIAAVQNLTAFFCDEWQKGEKQYYSVPIEQEAGQYFLRFNTASQFNYHVYVTGTFEDQHLTAQTFFSLYAGLDKTQDKEKVLREKPNSFSSFERTARASYWLQTGQTLPFIYKSANPSLYKVNPVQVIDLDHNRMEVISPDSAGRFSFTPPHDQRLDNSGYFAAKEILVYTEEHVAGKVYKTSLTLPVHRSITAHHNRQLGISLFFFTLLASASIVIYRRRRFAH